MISKRFYSFSTAVHTPICILGGGTAGLNISAQLGRVSGLLHSQIRVFEPSKLHYYQPSWTMVGGGIYNVNNTFKPQAGLFNRKINLSHLAVTRVHPEQNKIVTEDGSQWTYDHLIVATGNKCDFTSIKGLKEALDDPDCPVGSIYWKDYAEKFNKLASQIKQGKVIFTEPQMPIKCAGAPQKVMYLNDDRFRKNGVRSNIQIEFHKTIDVLFGVPKYAQSLQKIVEKKNIQVTFKSKLVEVKGKQRIAVFENQATKELKEVSFDLLHAVPPQTPPSFIAESGLGDAAGYCNVNKNTLLHNQYNNIWSLGDSSSLPTSKTAAAVMTQTPVLINNLLHVWQKHSSVETLPSKYEGYTSCPIFTGDKKLLLAEFKYDGVLDETFSKNQDKPHKAFYYLKKNFFPFAYWHLMPQGIWYGRQGVLPAATRLFTGVF